MAILNRLRGYKEDYQDDGSEFDSLPDAIMFAMSELIIHSAQLHFCHFKTKHGYVHEVLGELYPKFNDWADDLSETHLFPGVIKSRISKSGNIESDPKQPEVLALGILEVTRGRIGELKVLAEAEEETGLANICENIIVELERFFYKLKNLK